jgi:hypothetical protein
MAKKTKIAVLTLSQHFPKGHPKQGQPTGFVEHLKDGVKLHTIRTNYELWAQRAAKINAGQMELSLRVWAGKPYHSQQVEVARLQKLGVQRIEASYGTTDSLPQVWVDGTRMANVADELAKNDGLEYEDWLSWFFANSNTFDGVILHFTDMRY